MIDKIGAAGYTGATTMILFSCLAVLVLTGAVPAAGAPAPDDFGTTAKQQAQFDRMKQRRMEKQEALASGGAVAPGRWKQEEERAAAFDKEFGPGSYEGIVGLSDRCLYKDGCDKLATMDLIDVAYQLVALRKDVENKALAPDSSAYRSRHERIMDSMKAAVDGFRPRPGGSPRYEADFIKAVDPIATKAFTKDELLKYAERNAASADSAPFYVYLGQTLNAAGFAKKARAAFDAALRRDPKNAAALSGRAAGSTP